VAGVALADLDQQAAAVQGTGYRREVRRLYRDDGEVVDVAGLSRQPGCLVVSEQRGGRRTRSCGNEREAAEHFNGHGDFDQIDANLTP
jgi:hypothetical protein